MDSAEQAEPRRGFGSAPLPIPLLLILSMIGAAITWWPAHQRYRVYPFIGMPSVVAELAQQENLTEIEKRRVGLFKFETRAGDVGVVLALFGLGVGVAFGLGVGIARRSIASGLVGMLLLGAVGASAGYGAGFASEWIFEDIHSRQMASSNMKTSVVHGVGFGIIGLALGLCFPHDSLRTRLLRALCGALGGVVAGLIFVRACGAVFPLANTNFVVPKGAYPRLLWFEVGAVFIALGLTLFEHVRGVVPKRGSSA